MYRCVFCVGKKAFIDLIIIRIPLYLISCAPGCREASGLFPPTVPLEVKAPPSAVKLRLSRVEKPHNSCRTAENSHGSCSFPSKGHLPAASWFFWSRSSLSGGKSRLLGLVCVKHHKGEERVKKKGWKLLLALTDFQCEEGCF